MSALQYRRNDKSSSTSRHALNYGAETLSASRNPRNNTDGSSKKHLVCILGNSETIDNVLTIHEMWNKAFPSFWLVWGSKSSIKDLKLPRGIHVADGDRKTTWAQGIHEMLKRLREIYDCEYYFTHDDDLEFSINLRVSDGANRNGQINAVLERVLLEYQPAVASFPWKVGDTAESAMKHLNQIHGHQEVAPLTGFDSGMVLYHASIVDFFIPYMPKGEGGFHGDWSLCAHYINLFAPLLFKSNAIRINALNYKNLINIDNVPERQRKDPKVTEAGLLIHDESRHPYEYHLNTPFKSYLSSGLRNPIMRWGRKLALHDITWKVERGTVPYDRWKVLESINEIYDINHPLIRHNTYVKRKFSPSELQKYARSHFKIRFAIHIFTMNRLESFSRLWESIAIAYPTKYPIHIYIHMDYDNSSSIASFLSYAKHLQSLRTSHGQITLNINTQPKGLRYNVLDSWYPMDVDEYAIFLEDDVSVSKHFLQYAEASVERYFYNEDYHGALLGISLYNLRYNEVDETFWKVDSNANAYIFQQPQSWGAIYGPKQWNEFIKWYVKNKNIDPIIPNSLVNRWDPSKSWKKFLFRFMYSQGKFMIYPNLPASLSLSTNHMEWGSNDRVLPKRQKSMMAKFGLPLLDFDCISAIDGAINMSNPGFIKKYLLGDGHKLIDFTKLMPTIHKLQVFNVYGRQLKTINDLKAGIKPYSFDKCTLVLTVYDRYKTFKERLDYYQWLDLLESIVVVWNNIEIPVPELLQYKIPVHVLKQSVNSLNNRFYPHPEIATDCIINMDDDWNMNFQHIRYAVSVWRSNFFNYLVGHHHQGRTHVHVNGRYKYSKANAKSVSIMLPSGLVYHRKYMIMYTYALPASLRAIVDETMNCDDILFNFMVANATLAGPVVLEHWARPIDMGGLWRGIKAHFFMKDPLHIKERDDCLNRFVDIFGYMPLKYTTSFFSKKKSSIMPGLKDLKYFAHWS